MSLGPIWVAVGAIEWEWTFNMCWELFHNSTHMRSWDKLNAKFFPKWLYIFWSTVQRYWIQQEPFFAWQNKRWSSIYWIIKGSSEYTFMGIWKGSKKEAEPWGVIHRQCLPQSSSSISWAQKEGERTGQRQEGCVLVLLGCSQAPWIWARCRFPAQSLDSSSYPQQTPSLWR